MIEDFLSSSCAKPLDGFDVNIITHARAGSHFVLVVTEFGWKHVQTCLKAAELWVLK